MSKSIFLLLMLVSLPAHAVLEWHWEDSFTPEEKTGLQAVVKHAENGLVGLLGPLPFDYRVFFHRRTHADEPMPWAETRKYVARDVHFHVDTSFTWQMFNDDWTAPHELVHLVFPYLGDHGRWFAEGIASYLQYQVMYANGTKTWAECIARYRDRYRHAREGNPRHLSTLDLSKVVGMHGAYVRLYWGGAAYFMQADRRLYRENGIRLTDVISEYMHCCYDGRDTSYRQIIRIFDRISDSTVFTDTLSTTVAVDGFPDTEQALDWLADHPPAMHRNDPATVLLIPDNSYLIQ